jgi:hypothetical protein
MLAIYSEKSNVVISRKILIGRGVNKINKIKNHIVSGVCANEFSEVWVETGVIYLWDIVSQPDKLTSVIRVNRHMANEI